MNPGTISDEEIFQQNLQLLVNASRNYNLSYIFDVQTAGGRDLLFPDSIFDSWTEKFLISMYSCMDLIGLCSNLLMITSLLISPILIRDPCFFRFFLLMLSNLMMCFFCLPFTLFFLIRRYWTLGKTACQVIPFLQSVSVIINTLTTAMISVDRLLLVTGGNGQILRGHRASSSHTSPLANDWRPILTETAVIWSIAIITSIPIPLFQVFVDVSIGPTVLIMKCVEFWPSGHVKGSYLILNMLIQFLIPAGILVTTYVRITKHLINSTRSRNNSNRSHRSRTRTRHRFFSFLTYDVFTTHTNTVNVRVDSLTRSHIQRDRRVSQLLFWIMICYTMTWGPWNLYNIFLNYYNFEEAEAKSTHMTLALLYLLSMLNVPVNALLYGWNNPGIRKQTIRVLKSLKQMRNSILPGSSTQHEV